MIKCINEMNTQITSCIFIIVGERFRLTESGTHDHSKYAMSMGNLVKPIVAAIDLRLIYNGTKLLQLHLGLRGVYQRFSTSPLLQAIFPARNY